MNVRVIALIVALTSSAAAAREWHYTVIDSADYAPLIERFVNTLGPRPDGIRGSLLHGREFHLWVREDRSGARYRWDCVRTDAQWEYEVGDRVEAADAVLLGFNVEQVPCLHMLLRVRGY